MDAEIQALFKEAQQEVKLASGIPLTPEEEIAGLRQKEMDKMESFILRALGMARIVALDPEVVWTENGPEIRLRVDDHEAHPRRVQVFWLRKLESRYVLFAARDNGESSIASIEESDLIFGSRITAAIGSALDQ